MPKVKYCVTEFTPTANQVGMSHSFNAKVVINSDIVTDNMQSLVFLNRIEFMELMAHMFEYRDSNKDELKEAIDQMQR